jgi:glyoxylase-like metal-dependent hydrolase (beta-lactamase superfamily II)
VLVSTSKTWQFGRARVTVISEGTGWWPIERAVAGIPEAAWRAELEVNADDRLEIGFNLGHIALDGASILVDCGFGEYDPTDRTNPLVSVRDLVLTGGLDVSLATLGIAPAEISHVLLTHLHGDHILGATRVRNGRRVPAFPNARYFVMEEEWAAAPEWHQNASAIDAQKETLLAAGVVELVESEREIVPGVSYLPAPGESPGHAIVRIDGGAEICYFLGDLFHYPAEFRHFDWLPAYRDGPALIASRELLVPRFAAEDAWLIPAHHQFPAIGKLAEVEGGGYRWVPGE